MGYKVGAWWRTTLTLVDPPATVPPGKCGRYKVSKCLASDQSSTVRRLDLIIRIWLFLRMMNQIGELSPGEI